MGLQLNVLVIWTDRDVILQVEDRGSVPLILISPSHQIKHLEKLFLENDYFAFDSKKVSMLFEDFHNI